MAIKNKQRRDTYRSNVKVRPLRQNGLEAQNQGLDINEINIDHAGLPIIGRGGYQNRQRYTKVQKEYIVDVSQETYHPFVTLKFTFYFGSWVGGAYGLQTDYDGVEISLTSAGNSSNNPIRNYQFLTNYSKSSVTIPATGPANGDTLTLSSTQLKTETNNATPTITFNTATNTSDTVFNPTTGAATVYTGGLTQWQIAAAVRAIINNSSSYSAFAETTGPARIYIAATGTGTLGDRDLTIASSNNITFHHIVETAHNTGDISGGKVIVNITDNTLEKNSIRDLWTEFIKAIESSNGHGKGTFSFNLGPVSNDPSVVSSTLVSTAQEVNSLKISLTTTNIGESNVATVAILNTTGAGSPPRHQDEPRSRIDLHPNSLNSGSPSNFRNIDGAREWALNGFKEQEQDNTKFYEDIRVDHLQTAAVHSRKYHQFLDSETFDIAGNTVTYPRLGIGVQKLKTNWLGLGVGTSIINLDGVLSGSAGTGTAAIDPTTSGFTLDLYHQTKTSKKLSEEVKIRSVPLRDPLFGVHRENEDVLWYEDPYWKDADQRTWTNVLNRYSQWHSTFIEHVAGTHHESNPGIMDGVYYRVEDIPDEPLTGRIDLGLRVSRSVYGLIDSLATERHSFSFLNQFLENRRDPINIQENRYPVADRYTSDLAADDNLGRRFEDGWPVPTDPNSPYLPYLPGQRDGDNPIIFIDYFDQAPIDTHDYVDSPVYYSSIDEHMQQVMSDVEWDHDNNSGTAKIATNRSFLIDRREWQDSQHVITGTGFINTQNTGQSGIVYRELLR